VDLLGVIGWPVLDRIGGVVSPHGIGIAVGYLLGSVIMLREGRKRGLSEEAMGTILLWALLGAIFGARFFYVVAHFGEFESLIETLYIWRGGISLIGGIFGAIAFAYPFMRRHGYRFLQVMDSAAIGLAFGIIFGRIGDLVIGDHLGKPTDFVLGWAYRGGNLPGPWVEVPGVAPGPTGVWRAELSGGLSETLSRGGATLRDAGGSVLHDGAGVHQTALYDFFIAIGLFLFLRWLNRRPRREGVLIMTFAIVYGAGRVTTDFLRVDKHFFGLTGSQWGAILAMAVSVLALIWFARRPLPAEGAADEEGALPEDQEDRPRKRRGRRGIDRAEPPTRAPAGDRRTTEFDPPSEPGDDRR
jgi:phosphatidylglycerol---prolipoprotein diacylglyceryl transferase